MYSARVFSQRLATRESYSPHTLEPKNVCVCVCGLDCSPHPGASCPLLTPVRPVCGLKSNNRRMRSWRNSAHSASSYEPKPACSAPQRSRSVRQSHPLLLLVTSHTRIIHSTRVCCHGPSYSLIRSSCLLRHTHTHIILARESHPILHARKS